MAPLADRDYIRQMYFSATICCATSIAQRSAEQRAATYEGAEELLLAVAQVRALMFVTGITSEILGAMGDLEDALQAAAIHQTTVWPESFHQCQNRLKYSRCAAQPTAHNLQTLVIRVISY